MAADRYAALYARCQGLRRPHELSSQDFTREAAALATWLSRQGGYLGGDAAFVLLRLEELLGEATGQRIEEVVADDVQTVEQMFDTEVDEDLILLLQGAAT